MITLIPGDTKESMINESYNKVKFLDEVLSSQPLSDLSETLEEELLSKLAQKEKDLILAAELGKALLEKNEELSQTNEKIVEDFSLRLEHLEQEKYRLKRQLDVMTEEYEQRMSDLQNDYDTLKRSLDELDVKSRLSDREKTSLIHQLKEQNNRLSTELKLSNQRENEWIEQLNNLKSTFDDKRASMQDHVIYLESLKSEIDILSKRKDELEDLITSLLGERDTLIRTLDETSDKMKICEQNSREQHTLLRASQRDIHELTLNNQSLNDKLEALSRNISFSGGSSGTMSLMNELLEISSESKNRYCNSIHEEIEDSFQQTSFSLIEEKEEKEKEKEENEGLYEIQNEVLCAYKRILDLSIALQVERDKDQQQQQQVQKEENEKKRKMSHESSSVQMLHYKSGLLPTAVMKLSFLLEDLLNTNDDDDDDDDDNNNNSNNTSTQSKVSKLSFQGLLRDSEEKLLHCDSELKLKEKEIHLLQNKLSLAELELQGSNENRELYIRDLESLAENRDELVRKAWLRRDEALQCKNEAEIALARERIQLLTVNSQLLEVIQQKVELAQQLEDWQMDIKAVIDGQLQEKLSQDKFSQILKVTQSSSSSSPYLSFFQR